MTRRLAGRAVAASTRHAPDEPIPAARNGLDERRLVGIVTERGAQPLDRRIEAVLEIDEGPLGPQTLTQLLPRDDFARLLEHEPQDLERLFLQAHAHTAAAQLARAHIQLEAPEAQEIACVHGGACLGYDVLRAV